MTYRKMRREKIFIEFAVILFNNHDKIIKIFDFFSNLTLVNSYK